ncbi:MAG: Spy/CpxP family protein refolding chaperone [Deltaproteobacteria bacterium]|nr:Spy/CpxP family protein refolding chaperone [Deltaproteobacteria bacterium]
MALNFGTIGTIAYLRYQDQAPRLSREVPAPMPMRDLWRTLKLAETQRQAVRGLFAQHRAKVEEIRRELFQRRQELFELLKAETPGMTVIHAKIGEISASQGKLEEELVRHLLEFRKELTPEQRVAFLNLVQTRLNKALSGPCGPMGGRRGPWHGGPKGPGMGPGPGPGRPGPGMTPSPGPEGPGRPE